MAHLTADAGWVLHHRRDRLGLLGAHAVSPPRDHARDPGSFVHAVQGRAWLISPQTPAGWLHHRRGRLGLLSAHAVSPPRDHARDPGIRARSAGQGLLGAHAVSSPRDHARDPGSFVHAVQGRAWLVSPQTPAGWLHHRRDRLGLLSAHAVSPPRGHARDPGSFVHAVQGRACSALTL